MRYPYRNANEVNCIKRFFTIFLTLTLLLAACSTPADDTTYTAVSVMDTQGNEVAVLTEGESEQYDAETALPVRDEVAATPEPTSEPTPEPTIEPSPESTPTPTEYNLVWIVEPTFEYDPIFYCPDCHQFGFSHEGTNMHSFLGRIYAPNTFLI